MNIVRLIFTLILLASIPCAILLIQYAYKRQAVPGAKYFILLLISAIMYNMAYIGEINADHFAEAMFWFNLQHIPIPIQHYLWLMMSLEYSKATKKQLKVAKYIGLCHPIAYILIFFTNPFHHLYISNYRFESNGYFPVLFSEKEPLFMLMVISGTLMGITAIIFYIRGMIRSPKLHRYGYVIMIIASIFPWVAVYLNATNSNYLGIDYFPVVCIISGTLYLFGIFKFSMFDTIPIATEMVFRQSKEGIMLIDLAGCIIDVNRAFITIYPELKALSKRHTFSSFLKHHSELQEISHATSSIQYCLLIEGEERHYAAQITPILMEETVEIGRILTITDITLFVENQSMLEAIAKSAIEQAATHEISFLQAQITPHFLNNTLSVIGSMITRNPHEAKELIGNLGEYLAQRCYFDSSTPMVLLEQELETVNTYVAIEKARFGERLNFHILCENIPKVNIPRLIIQPLVENAIRHGILKKADGGNVWLIITEGDGKVNFEIKDDGVGLSEEKRQELVMGENENQGIGIQNIHKRLIKHYDERLKIESEKGKGTAVSFSIPHQEHL